MATINRRVGLSLFQMEEGMVVSEAAAKLDTELVKWRERPLGEYPFLFLDAYCEQVREDGQVRNLAILIAAVRAVDLFSSKFAPYPYGSLSIIQTDLNDGMEYDGPVFLATKFYNEYNGSARSNLVTIGVHEIAHQWWFGLVGNDQAMEPWPDEALCVYSEASSISTTIPTRSIGGGSSA